MNNTIEAAFLGRVGRDPELRRAKGGELALLTLSVAVGDDGDDANPPEWVKIAVFGERAEALAEQLAKGARIYCEGKLRLERWEGRDGAPRAGLAVTATLLQPLGQIGRRRPKGARHANGRDQPGPQPSSQPQHPPVGRNPAPAGAGGDDGNFDWDRGDAEVPF